jgi:hypothetical protein
MDIRMHKKMGIEWARIKHNLKENLKKVLERIQN